jgi:hypothetical protein
MSFKNGVALNQPGEHSHTVQFFDDDNTLSESVALFAGHGLLSSAGVLIVAVPVHIKGIQSVLFERGIDVEKMKATGQLTFQDAEAALKRFLKNGQPDPKTFDEVIGQLIRDLLSKFSNVYAYGEMVGLLWKEGNAIGTVALEELWNDLQKRNPFTLFCGYSL